MNELNIEAIKIKTHQLQIGDIIYDVTDKTIGVFIGLSDVYGKIKYYYLRLLNYKLAFDGNINYFENKEKEVALVSQLLELKLNNKVTDDNLVHIAAHALYKIGHIDEGIVKGLYTRSKLLDDNLTKLNLKQLGKKEKWYSGKKLLDEREQLKHFAGRDGNGTEWMLIRRYSNYYFYVKIGMHTPRNIINYLYSYNMNSRLIKKYISITSHLKKLVPSNRNLYWNEKTDIMLSTKELDEILKFYQS